MKFIVFELFLIYFFIFFTYLIYRMNNFLFSNSICRLSVFDV